VAPCGLLGVVESPCEFMGVVVAPSGLLGVVVGERPEEGKKNRNKGDREEGVKGIVICSLKFSSM
jgi:hypothetical protein